MDKKALQIYDFNQTPVTVIMDKNNEPWWVAKEVCEILGLKGSISTILVELDHDEKSQIKLKPSELIINAGLSDGGDDRPRMYRIISEPGLYRLIFKSNKPSAVAFQKWVTHEVLPTIHKTGGYIWGAENMTDEEILAKALEISRTMLVEREKQDAH